MVCSTIFQGMCDFFSLLLSAVIDYSLVVKLKTFFIGEVM